MAELRLESFDPVRFAASEEALKARIAQGVDEELALIEIVRTVADDEAVEIPFQKVTLCGLFWESFRRAVVPVERPVTAWSRAMGGHQVGVMRVSVDDVRALATELSAIDLAALPPPECKPWLDGLDPGGDLDELLRAGLRELIATYRAAAERGSAILVIG